MIFKDTGSLRAIRDAAVTAGLHQPTQREDLLYGITSRVTANIPAKPAPRDQIMADLMELNRYENLPDGSVPLLTWLDNALDKTFGTPEEKLFKTFIERLSATTSTTSRPIDTAPMNGGNERVVHRDDMLDYAFLDKGFRVGASVAKLRVTRYVNGQPANNASGSPLIGSGTCWLLTKELMLTNHHVINERDIEGELASAADFAAQAEHAEADFDFNSPRATVQTVAFRGVAIADRALDYALLRLAAPENRDALPLSTTPLAPAKGDSIPVNIIQHPNGKPKRIAIRNNLVNAADADVINYFTDTLTGSSGSPVFNDNWQVVALHRGWQPVVNVNYQGKDTAYANYGTHITRVLAHIRDHAPAPVMDEIRQTHAPALDNF